jgi:DMSO/TMAO reductase YedYZ molybdopterin-dependent catalytic subunit
MSAGETRPDFDFAVPSADDSFDRSRYTEEELAKRLPPGQTLAAKFPHLEYATIPTDVDVALWPVRVFGQCKVHRSLPVGTLMRLAPHRTQVQDFHCITGWSVLDTEWGGMSGLDLILLSEPDDEVTTVMVHGRDEFSTCVWVEDFAKGLLAVTYRGKPLAPHHGFPLRFVAPPEKYQYKSCKWVTGIEFLREHTLGFWEIRAYNDEADVAKNERYLSPDEATGKKTVAQIRAAFKRGGLG